MPSPPLTIDQYALRCGVSPRSVREWRRTGRLVLDQAGLILPEQSDRLRAATAQRVRQPHALLATRDPGEPRPAAVELAEALDPQQEKAALDKMRRLEIQHRMAAARGALVGTKDWERFWRDSGEAVRAVIETWVDTRSSELHATATARGEHATWLFMRAIGDELLKAISETIAAAHAKTPTEGELDVTDPPA